MFNFKAAYPKLTCFRAHSGTLILTERSRSLRIYEDNDVSLFWWLLVCVFKHEKTETELRS